MKRRQPTKGNLERGRSAAVSKVVVGTGKRQAKDVYLSTSARRRSLRWTTNAMLWRYTHPTNEETQRALTALDKVTGNPADYIEPSLPWPMDEEVPW